jgi:hypothetical protein
MMEKIPIVTPNSDRIVRKRLDFKAFQAKLRLSIINRRASMGF